MREIECPRCEKVWWTAVPAPGPIKCPRCQFQAGAARGWVERRDVRS
jgi:uncharacterized C2H2 Zn-finger protein